MRFLTIDEPNADELDAGTGTFIHAISNNDEMVGSYQTNIDDFGFSDIGGSFTALWGPLIATSREANGVDSSGEVVGYYVDSFFHTHGFLLTGGTYKTLNEPKANNYTVAEGINDAGEVVGYYGDSNGQYHGFTYSGGVNGTYTEFDVPGAMLPLPTAINNAGQIVGYYFDGVDFHGFLDVNGTFATLDDPLGFNGTFVQGINDQGVIVGYYKDIKHVTHGFRYLNGVYTTLDFPSATGTELFGINNAGKIVGSYWNGVSNHGFEMLPVVNSDFNSNGTSDVLWRNSNGALIDWSMNGSTISGSSYVTYQGNQIAPDASWSIADTSDFNGDGSTDVLWRQSSGSLSLWSMKGSTVTSSSAVTSQGNAVAPDASWSVAGTGDFGGDGKADILWRQSSGALALWQMNGSSIVSSNAVTYQGNSVAPDASWSVAGVADFNGDAKTDLLWRNANGALALWQMNGATLSSSDMVTSQGNVIAPDASWSIAGIGDFNSDGSVDILWRQSGGSLAIWLMNGSTVQSSAAITCQGNPVAPDASWKIVEIGNFNGDGNSDILWRNANGSMAEWLMNGSQISASLIPSSQGNPVAPDSSWSVQAKPTNFG